MRWELRATSGESTMPPGEPEDVPYPDLMREVGVFGRGWAQLALGRFEGEVYSLSVASPVRRFVGVVGGHGLERVLRGIVSGQG